MRVAEVLSLAHGKKLMNRFYHQPFASHSRSKATIIQLSIVRTFNLVEYFISSVRKSPFHPMLENLADLSI